MIATFAAPASNEYWIGSLARQVDGSTAKAGNVIS